MDGGLINTPHHALADRLRQLRDYGKAAGGADIAWFGFSAGMRLMNN